MEEKSVVEFRKGTFIITEENDCPLYNIGEELAVDQHWIYMPASKATCLILAQDIVAISTDDVSSDLSMAGENKSTRFQCRGCVGRISFEYKKGKEYTTIQMKLLAATERKEQIEGVSQVADHLAAIELFKPLSSDDLVDLITLLQVKTFDYGFPICQFGDPGTHLYILLEGKVEVLDEDGVVLSEMGKGDVFGEMSLLSGDRVSTTIIATEPCEIATLNQKNFNHILKKFPGLQVFLYKLVVRRIAAMNKERAEELASGMTGQVADIPLDELCQMINSNQKTGRLRVEFDRNIGVVVFKQGDVVSCDIFGKSGAEAFHELILVSSGRFRFTQGITSRERKLESIGGFMAMLMEGMRLKDDRDASKTIEM